MKQFGLIGQALQHSYSKLFFEQEFKKKHLSDYTYNLYELKRIEDFPSFIACHPLLSGLNVTIPYKKSIIPYLDEIDSVARAIGAVNVIKIETVNNRKKIVGYNTDYIGFTNSLSNQNLPEKALILGTGGSAVAVCYALSLKHIDFQCVSRTFSSPYLTYQNLTKEIIESYSFIINCTPVGMYPHQEERPDIPYDGIGERHFLYDLIYNPAVTKFMETGISHGARVKNGLEMLQIQALETEKIWKL